METTPKFSIFDFLAMIIPGAIIMAIIVISLNIDILGKDIEVINCNYIKVSDSNGFIKIFFLICTAYTLGLINNSISEFVFRPLRNNPRAIRNSLNKVIRENGVIYLKNPLHSANRQATINSDCCFINKAKYIYKFINRAKLYLKFLKYKKYIVFKCMKHVKFYVNCAYNIILSPKITNFPIINIRIEYYKAYYILSQNKLLGNVPKVEEQVIFLRNIILPISMLYFINGDIKGLIPWFNNWYLALCAIFCIILMIIRQKKVYNMIWEAANYYDLHNA